MPLDPLPNLCHIPHQFLCLLLPSLLLVCFSQVAHTCQCVRMLCTKHPHFHFHHINLQILCLLQPSLILVCQCQIVHTCQCVRMFCTKHLPSDLCHLFIQFLCIIPISIFIEYQCKLGVLIVTIFFDCPGFIGIMHACFDVWKEKVTESIIFTGILKCDGL